MKVLLINPLTENPAMPGPPKMILNEGGVYPPQGLLHLASFEAKRGKHDVKIIDSFAEGLDYPAIERRIAQEKPDVVGVTLTTLYLGDGYRVLKSARNVSKDIITIAGGPHATLYPRQTIKLAEVDYAVCGEAEYVFGEMLDRLQNKQSLEGMEGVLTKANADLPAKQLLIQNLDDLPPVDYTLLPYNKYRSIMSKGNPVIVMMTSRGCPFHCSYCPQAGTKLRKRNAKLVADEVEQCLKLGIKDILFFDELFTLEHQRVRDLCGEFQKRNLKFRFHIRTRIKDTNQEMIDLLAKSGCHLIQFGIESGTERIQKLMNKNLDLKVVEQVIKMTRKAGILTYGNFMLGSPGETHEEMEATINFSIKLHLDFAVFAITMLLPKTDYYEMAFKQGKITEDFWEKYIADPMVPIKNAYWPDFGIQYLENECKKAYLKFYFRPWFMMDYLLRICSFQQMFIHAKSALAILNNFAFKKMISKD